MGVLCSLQKCSPSFLGALASSFSRPFESAYNCLRRDCGFAENPTAWLRLGAPLQFHFSLKPHPHSPNGKVAAQKTFKLYFSKISYLVLYKILTEIIFQKFRKYLFTTRVKFSVHEKLAPYK